MKPLLIVSAVALAAPAFAQYPTTTQQTPPAPPTTGTMTGEEMAPTTQTPMTPEEQEQAKKAGEAQTQTETPTTTTTTTTTQTTTAPGTQPMEPGMAPTTTTTQTGTPPATEPGMAPTTTTQTGTTPTPTEPGMAPTTTTQTGTTPTPTEPGMAPTATMEATTPTAPGAATTMPTMAHWDFRGDMGAIGSANWGVGEHKGTGASTMGMGGPIDVESQWSTLSPSGAALTPLEFGIWILDAHGQDVDRAVEATKRSRKDNLPAVQVLNVTAGALAEADIDGDWRVSREELSTFAGS